MNSSRATVRTPPAPGSSGCSNAPYRRPEFPNTGRIVPEIGRSDVREVFLRTYRIVYRIVDRGIIVLTVFEGHRTLGELAPDLDE